MFCSEFCWGGVYRTIRWILRKIEKEEKGKERKEERKTKGGEKIPPK